MNSDTMNEFVFNTDRDLVFFDIESTGLNVMKDRILQIALIKYPKGSSVPEEFSTLINPGIPISEEAYAVHGISNEMVRNKPTFSQLADKIFQFIDNADLSGYNSDRFDIPMLMEEFARCGMSFDVDKRNLIDVQKIFYKMEPRTLKAAYKLYCDGDLSDAHDALADTKATVEVLKGQIKKYSDADYVDGDGQITSKPIQNDIKKIAKFLADDNNLDVTQRLKLNTSRQVVFNFGKYSGQIVSEVFVQEPNYYHWMMEKDFSAQVKQIISTIWDDMKKKKS